MKYIAKSIVIVAVGVLVLLMAPLRAEEGRIPIFEPVVLDGNLADISGRYIVTRTIQLLVPGINIIRIIGTGTESIDIDLNGFSLIGNGGGKEIIYAEKVRKLTVHGGSAVQHANEHVIAVQGLAAVTSDEVTVENMAVARGLTGIRLEHYENVVLRNNRLTDSDVGIFLSGAAAEPPVTGDIDGNIFRDIVNEGLDVADATSNLAITDNRFENVAGFVLIVRNSRGVLVRGNSLTGTGAAGISMVNSRGCSIIGNSVNGIGIDGILLANTNECLIMNNVVAGNGRDGMIIDGARNHIEGNVLSNNSGRGLRFQPTSSGNVYGRNSARGNGPIGVCPAPVVVPCPATPDFCNEGMGNSSFGDNFVPGPPPC